MKHISLQISYVVVCADIFVPPNSALINHPILGLITQEQNDIFLIHKFVVNPKNYLKVAPMAPTFFNENYRRMCCD